MNAHNLAELGQTLFEESGDALFLFDPDSEQVLDVNPMAQRLCGWTRQELLHHRIDFLFRSEQQGGLQRLRHAYRKTGPFHSREGYLLRHRQDGLWVPVSLTVARLHAEPRILGLITGRDVTEQRQAQELLRQKEAELREVLASVTDCLWSADIDSDGSVHMRYCSPVAERLTSQPIETFLQGWSGWLEVTHPEDRDKLDSALARLQNGEVVREEVEHRLAGAEPRWVRSSVLARHEGKRLRLNGVVSDITEAVTRREQLQASEARCRSLLENLEQSVFLKGPNLRIVAANRRFCDGISHTEAEILGKSDFDLYPLELASKYRADDLRVLTEGCRLEVEEQNLLEGRLRWVRVIKTPVRDNQDRIVGVLGIFWDVTEQRALEDQLRQAARMEAVGQLAGGVAHDFNNLLTAILGNLSLLRMQLPEGLRATVAGLIEGAEQASWRAATLTRQLLGFSRRTLLHFQPVDANRTVEEVLGLLHPTIDPRIRLLVERGEGLWPVVADPGQLCQVLLNLAINARDAVQEVLDDERPTQPALRGELTRGEGGWIRLETTNIVLAEEDEPLHVLGRAGEFVRLRVADNGMGIAPEVLPRIFEPFFTTKGPDRGTGLGLAMVFGIVQQHRGWIECSSQPGRGTTFDIYLPRSQEQRVESPARQSGLTPGRGMILLVDDEPMLLNLGSTVLRQAGYEVLLANDGEQAVDLYRQAGANIDLVVLDRTMPRLSGRETLRQLRQLNGRVPVLIASGYAAEQLSDEEREALLAFLPKPYSPEDLVIAVRAAIEKATQRWASEER